MNITLSDLKQFHRLSSSIKGNNILPILDYVRFGDGKIVKTSLHQFVQFDCPSADTVMLVNEGLLSVKTGKSQADGLTLTQKGNKVTLTDSVTPTTFQVPDIKTFPAIPSPTSERFPVSDNFMKVLRNSQHFPLNPDPKNLSWMSFVMIGNKHICASDGHAFYMEPIEEEFQIVLEKPLAQIVSKMDVKEFAESESYIFFYTPNAVIGFSKQEIGYSNIIPYGDTKDAKVDFFASAIDLQKFNEECAQSSKLPWIDMKPGILEMNDSELDIHIVRKMENITPSAAFTYNPVTMNKLLSIVDGDQIEFYRGKAWYWIKPTDQKCTMLIMQLEGQP